MLEILAPAGNPESAKAAIYNGANAIYLGYRAFSARQSAENFDEDALREIVKLARFFDVKVYVAMNTMIKDEETEPFLRALLSVWGLGVDAIILQDVLLGKAIHKLYPDIVLHLSTQAGVCNENGAYFAKQCGFSRVILARETPLDEIRKIAKIIETEAFVQGALCTCFSGQCYFSSFAGGNSGNRGRCKQPCRKLYAYNRNENTVKNYALSLSDLSVGEDIRKYIEAGVTSFKIEGRMRRPEYVAAAVRYYKTLLNAKSTPTEIALALSDLKRTYNRGNYTKGLSFGQDKRLLSTAVQGHLGEKVGVVKVISGKYCVESAYKPITGDAFKILRGGNEIGGAQFLKYENRGFLIHSKHRLKNGDGVFVTTDNALTERLLQTKKTRKIEIVLRFFENDYAYAECEGVTLYSQDKLQTANSKALTEEELRECFGKTDGLPFLVAFAKIEIKGDIFIPKSQLNAFRRAFYQRLQEKFLQARGEISFKLPTKNGLNGLNKKRAVIASDFEGVATDIAVYKPNAYSSVLPKSFMEGAFEKYLYYPPLATEREERVLETLLKIGGIDGVYAENYAGLFFAEKNGVKAFVGTGLNISNAIAVQELCSLSTVCYYTVSKELSLAEQKPLISEKAFALSGGDIKIMDLCYCPFGKTCKECDKKSVYTLTDENGREFPVRRYQDARGECRFEVYNCASLIGNGLEGMGKLYDISVSSDKKQQFLTEQDLEKQKESLKRYTFGHATRGVL